MWIELKISYIHEKTAIKMVNVTEILHVFASGYVITGVGLWGVFDKSYPFAYKLPRVTTITTI